MYRNFVNILENDVSAKNSVIVGGAVMAIAFGLVCVYAGQAFVDWLTLKNENRS